MSAPLPWYLLGAGNMGTLAAHYLSAARLPVIVLRRDDALNADRTASLNKALGLNKVLTFADGRAPQSLSLPALPRSQWASLPPLRQLIVACKTPYSAAALAGLPLADNVLVLRLQNGLGSLDGLLPTNARLIEVVTTSAVKGHHPEHQLVAENQTWMGPAAATGNHAAAGHEAVGDHEGEASSRAPAWFTPLARHWPGLEWTQPIRYRQWHKLVANALINPLTGLHDLPNGALLDDPVLHRQMAELAAEADALLTRLDAGWPGDSLPRVEAIARATAGNTSSMRADMQRGTVTEIDAINGWLLDQAARLGLALPAHQAIVAAVRARQTGSA